MLSTQCITLRLCTHAGFARREPLGVYAGCISHHDISTSMHRSRERASWKFARSESDPRLMKRNKQKNRPRERFHSRRHVVLGKTLYAFGWRIRAQHAGSPAYNGPPLLFCTRPPRLQLNARYQRLSGEKHSLRTGARVFIYTRLYTHTNQRGIHS
jgi:hypothetical protein